MSKYNPKLLSFLLLLCSIGLMLVSTAFAEVEILPIDRSIPALEPQASSYANNEQLASDTDQQNPTRSLTIVHDAQIITLQQFIADGAGETLSIQFDVATKQKWRTKPEHIIGFRESLPDNLPWHKITHIEYLAQSYEVWRLVISIPEANTLWLELSDKTYPTEKLWIRDGQNLLEFAYDNAPIIFSPFIQSSKITVEIWHPINPLSSPPRLSFKALGYNPSNISESLAALSTDANTDATCNNIPVVNSCSLRPTHSDEMSAISHYVTGQLGSCTGSLINNFQNDRSPFFITAAHCISSYTIGSEIILYNYSVGPFSQIDFGSNYHPDCASGWTSLRAQRAKVIHKGNLPHDDIAILLLYDLNPSGTYQPIDIRAEQFIFGIDTPTGNERTFFSQLYPPLTIIGHPAAASPSYSQSQASPTFSSFVKISEEYIDSGVYNSLLCPAYLFLDRGIFPTIEEQRLNCEGVRLYSTSEKLPGGASGSAMFNNKKIHAIYKGSSCYRDDSYTEAFRFTGIMFAYQWYLDRTTDRYDKRLTLPLLIGKQFINACLPNTRPAWCTQPDTLGASLSSPAAFQGYAATITFNTDIIFDHATIVVAGADGISTDSATTRLTPVTQQNPNDGTTQTLPQFVHTITSELENELFTVNFTTYFDDPVLFRTGTNNVLIATYNTFLITLSLVGQTDVYLEWLGEKAVRFSYNDRILSQTDSTTDNNITLDQFTLGENRITVLAPLPRADALSTITITNLIAIPQGTETSSASSGGDGGGGGCTISVDRSQNQQRLFMLIALLLASFRICRLFLRTNKYVANLTTLRTVNNGKLTLNF